MSLQVDSAGIGSAARLSSILSYGVDGIDLNWMLFTENNSFLIFEPDLKLICHNLLRCSLIETYPDSGRNRKWSQSDT